MSKRRDSGEAVFYWRRAADKMGRRLSDFQHCDSKRRDYEMVASRLKAWRRQFHSLRTVEKKLFKKVVLCMLQAFSQVSS